MVVHARKDHSGTPITYQFSKVAKQNRQIPKQRQIVAAAVIPDNSVLIAKRPVYFSLTLSVAIPYCRQ